MPKKKKEKKSNIAFKIQEKYLLCWAKRLKLDFFFEYPNIARKKIAKNS